MGNADGNRGGKGRKGGPKGSKSDQKPQDCFELVTPVSFTMPDGTTLTGESRPELREASKEEMRDALKSWHQSHPDVKERGQLQFPVEIVIDDGTTQTIDSAEELKAAREDCE